MKKEFTTEHWERALAAVFVRSISDPQFRHLCLSDPQAAVEAVAPDLALPPHFHFRFVDHRRDVVYTYLLPPMLEDGTSTLDYAQSLIEQDIGGKTHPPTNTNGVNTTTTQTGSNTGGGTTGQVN